MTLPQYGSPDDALDLLRYLKPKPTGATVAEARKALGDSAVDGRKLSAFQFWGLIDVDDDDLVLTPTGREVARDETAMAKALGACLRSTPAYKSALERAFYQDFDELDTHELGAFWHDQFASALGTDADSSISRACGAFLRVAETVGLGTYVLGRRGQPTRLELDHEAVQMFVEEGSDDPSGSDALSEVDEGEEEAGDEDEHDPADAVSPTANGDEGEEDPPSSSSDGFLKVFLSHGKNGDLVDQVATMLEVADIEYEIAVDEESTAIPVPEKVLGSMRRCNAGVVVVSVDDEDAETFTVNENVLIEIGAAFVLYDQRVVLVWDKRLTVPSNLQGLYRCEFEGQEMNWSSGMKLMKAVKGFKM